MSAGICQCKMLGGQEISPLRQKQADFRRAFGGKCKEGGTGFRPSRLPAAFGQWSRFFCHAAKPPRRGISPPAARKPIRGPAAPSLGFPLRSGLMSLLPASPRFFCHAAKRSGRSVAFAAAQAKPGPAARALGFLPSLRSKLPRCPLLRASFRNSRRLCRGRPA